ncbi:MAG: 4Fe-4S binding protein [Lachnospiraceae bacterium]|nr:4Fe-4S binding protein [Lachnospiraceae bacterium]
MKSNKRHWYDYLWIWPIVYFALGFFNIIFAWLGMIDFIVPIIIAVVKGNKSFCNRYCGRGKLFAVIPTLFKGKTKRVAPKWMYSKWFRYGFLVFFLTMFGSMVYQTYLVFGGATLRTAVKLFWTFRVPWRWAYTTPFVPDWIIQYSYGFYSLMLTSTLIGLIVMVLYRPRTWCTFCPMGTMTQGICQLRNRNNR